MQGTAVYCDTRASKQRLVAVVMLKQHARERERERDTETRAWTMYDVELTSSYSAVLLLLASRHGRRTSIQEGNVRENEWLDALTHRITGGLASGLF